MCGDESESTMEKCEIQGLVEDLKVFSGGLQ
jgi:hypothetical protein